MLPLQRTRPIAAFLAVAALLASPAAAQTKLLRFPDVHGDQVAFCYAGDLWSAPSAGGTARRLTAHPGLELFPKFSPDGQWIAFTGQYDGDEQVYVMPAIGGEPVQLTFYPARGPLPPRWGYDNQVYGWSRDGKSVLFRSMRESWELTGTRLFLVPAAGGLPKPLEMPVSGGGDLSPDERKVVYSPLTRDFRTWKRYQGGWAQDLFVFDRATRELTPVAHHVRTERDPMWIDETSIVFASDRDGTLNLYSFDTKSGEVQQLTTSRSWDVRWPSRGEDGEVVYENDGELWIYDTRKRSNRKLDIVVPDDGVSRRPSRVLASSHVEGAGLSPKGERALFTARGDVFTAPIEHGPTRNLTHSSGTHDRGAEWSPDGATIAYISDATGEDEIWTIAQDGSGEPKQVTSGGDRMLLGLRWSPDGKRIAFNDKSNRLRVVTLETRAIAEVARNAGGPLGDFTWSPDGRWLAFSMTDPNQMRSIYLWRAEPAELHRVTDELWNETEPVWSPDGDYLYYLSDREYRPQLYTGLEWNFSVNRTTGLYAMALRKDVAHPFPPRSDEVTVAAKADAKPEEAGKDETARRQEAKAAGETQKPKEDEKKEGEAKPVEIDFDGLAGRVARVPVEPDNYVSLNAVKGHLVYLRVGAPYYGRESERKTALLVFSFEKREPSELVEDCNGYTVSQDGTKLLVASDAGFARYEAREGGKDTKKDVSTANLYVERVPREEWNEVFREVWRRFRDYFYVENMHGYDWQGLRKQYEDLLPHVGHRSDLNYVLGEMVAELNVGHAYIAGGDWAVPERPKVALLGARLELDPQARRFRIARILRGQNEESRYRSPLTEIGVDVKEGEYLLAIDGEELSPDADPYRVLRHKADRPIELTVGATPDPAAARKVRIQPLQSEVDLNYLDYVLRNRERVDKLSNGRFAYVHVPDMGENGIREFIKWYYGQVRKDGLILDDRNNGGGNVSQMLIERLRRVLLGTGFSRNEDFTQTYPGTVFTGPMVCLLNENSASDGDIFPWMFREAGLGPLIGKRSWGGVVGITDHGPLIDGGTCSVPEFGNNAASGDWAVEGHGVDPDIVVENDARSVLEGRDPQLERAVAELEKLCAARSARLPARPPPPVKTQAR
jgi:tricorn protease